MSDYVTIMSSDYVTIIRIMSIDYVKLCHYYTDYVILLCQIMSDLHPNYLELTETNSRPMLQAMTDKCPGAQATLHNGH